MPQIGSEVSVELSLADSVKKLHVYGFYHVSYCDGW
jgi:hypothetical protein